MDKLDHQLIEMLPEENDRVLHKFERCSSKQRNLANEATKKR